MSEHSLPPATAPETSSSLARRVVLASIIMLLLGIVGGLVWLWLADPAEWQVTNRGIVMTESASQGQFSVVALYVLVGAVASLVWGSVVGWRLQDLGWLITPLVVVMTVAAALLAWRIGVALGPPDPASVPDPALGERIPARLAVQGVVPFLVWPIFGLVGVVCATWATRGSADQGTAPQERAVS